MRPTGDRRRRVAIVVAVTALAVGAWSISTAAASGSEGPPLIESLGASHITETSSKIEGKIDPDGAATEYTLWVRYDPCQHGAGECALKPQTEQLGSGTLPAGDLGHAIHRRVGKLEHGCLYQFSVVAKNAHGEVESSLDNVETAGREGLLCLRHQRKAGK
jgi:hypothetical protein